MDKNLSEQDITTKFILPALQKADWNSDTQIREQYSFTAGRIVVRGQTVKRGEQKRVDVLLFHKNQPFQQRFLLQLKDRSLNWKLE